MKPTLHGEVTGKISLGGKSITGKSFKESYFLVEQSDSNWPYLKVCETCLFTAQLFGLEISKTKERVEIVLREVGLSDARDTLNKNLSGGQQRLVANICFFFSKTNVYSPEPIICNDQDVCLWQ